jgi:hypothetical protein
MLKNLFYYLTQIFFIDKFYTDIYLKIDFSIFYDY